MKLTALIGSGDKIMLFISPFLLIGLSLNIAFPTFFSVGGPSGVLAIISYIFLVPGIAIWAWSVFLIATKASRNELITTGPYSLVKHPLYTGVALLVLPSAGFLLNTWLGVSIGAVMYIGTKIYSHEEENKLAEAFGVAWDEYCKKVKAPWL